MHLRRFSLLALLLIAVTLGSDSAAAQLTEDRVIDETLRIDAINEAEDLVAELQALATAYVTDQARYSGVGYNFTKASSHILHFRGSTVSTMATILPLLPGSVADPTTLRGRLAAQLKTEVTTYLLDNAYWEWEHATNTGGPYLSSVNPNSRLAWNHRWRVGPHWEKLHALWAYAYYTDDWATIETNWSFIKTRYLEGERVPDDRQRAAMVVGSRHYYRNAANDLANGLIGYVRMAERVAPGDATLQQARLEARAALRSTINHLDVSWENCPIHTAWEHTPATMTGEWSPGYNLTPEIGRWLNTQARPTALARLDEATNSAELRNRWWAGYLNNLWHGDVYGDEDLWGLPNLSHQLFLGRAWMLAESGNTLRQVKPWPVTLGYPPQHRDMLYIRSLYALISREAPTSWVAVNR